MAIIEHKCKTNKDSISGRYQDKKYGKGRRVANKMKSGYRCTICGEIITIPKILWGD